MKNKTSSSQFIAYWLGYAPNGVAFAPMPQGTTVAVAFSVGLNAETTLATDYISSGGYTWDEILSMAAELQSAGIKVLAGVMPTSSLTWNDIDDPATFATNLKALVIDEWGLDGIEIDPEQEGGVAPSDNFIQTVQAIRAAFGNDSMLTYVSYVLDLDNALLSQCATDLDYVNLMGYFWPLDEMKSQYQDYVKVVSPTPVYLGVSPKTPAGLDVATQVADYAASTSGGLMMFATSQDVESITGDPDGTWSQTLLAALNSGGNGL